MQNHLVKHLAVFAPTTCKKSKEQVEKEQEEITKDFNKIDKETKK
jgi:hypothetical protein